jgi:hypothetical protein
MTTLETGPKPVSESRPDLVHPFQCERGREGECSHFYSWLGGFVKCGMKESDPIHKNGPHVLLAKNGDQGYCTGRPANCEFCAMEVLHPEAPKVGWRRYEI